MSVLKQLYISYKLLMLSMISENYLSTDEVSLLQQEFCIGYKRIFHTANSTQRPQCIIQR